MDEIIKILTKKHTATVRTYYKDGEGIERWRCPICGFKQDLWVEIKDDEEINDYCGNCQGKVYLTYRRIHRKNY